MINGSGLFTLSSTKVAKESKRKLAAPLESTNPMQPCCTKQFIDWNDIFNKQQINEVN
eukprot:m.320378 g.320378  ORF g.320378 m.320378 type:complete len:58 (+) comp16518_c1_seq17:2481-2654(+)